MDDKKTPKLQDNQFEELSAEEQQAILEKYDIESNTRTLGGVYETHYLLWINGLFFISTVHRYFWSISSANSTNCSFRIRISICFFTISSIEEIFKEKNTVL